jgi:16S rRNA (cytosine967-C5)-methyltransferase
VVPPVADPRPSARAAALEALHQVDHSTEFLREALHAVFDRGALDPRDRALATQLAAGVIRHRRTLRLILSHLRGGHGRAGSIQANLRNILELGAFQLLFLDRVPSYAAVNEAVEQARRTGHGRGAEKAAGFVNGMLRGLERLLAGHDPDGRPARDALPHPAGGVLRLKAAVLPDPADGLPAYLGAAYSLPDWLVSCWHDAYGDQTEDICRWSNRRPRLFARVNPSRRGEMAGPPASPETPDAGVILPGPRPGSVDVSDGPADRLEALLAAGVLTIQDPTSMAPVEALAPAPGETILDLCASPGTKTTQMAEALATAGPPAGRIVACDRSEEKLQPIREAVAVRGLTNVTVGLAEDIARLGESMTLSAETVAADRPLRAAVFDAALVDAPCSNTGVLARRPEARWRLRPEDAQELPPIQLMLLDRAAGFVRPGGRLVYSTCSILPEENETVVRQFLAAHPAWREVRRNLTLPGPDHDGGFWALLAR